MNQDLAFAKELAKYKDMWVALQDKGRIYGCGDRAKPTKTSKRPLPQASLRGKRGLNPSSLQRIPTPLHRCCISHVQALSTLPLPSGTPRALYRSEAICSRCRCR